MNSHQMILICVIMCLVFMSCDLGSSGPSGGTISPVDYGGISAVGDYIVVIVDESNRQVSYYNYTTGDSLGPLAYSKLDTNNWGFQNIYKTENFLRESDSCYALFLMMKNMAVVFQLFTADSNKMIDWPIYALCRKPANMTNYKESIYNFMKFKINATDGNYELGFLGFDIDNPGTCYGAVYNDRACYDSWSTYYKGLKGMGKNSNLAGFVYDQSLVANYYDDPNDPTSRLIFVASKSNDFVIDCGQGKGAAFAVRQANDSSWSPKYNGTYFVLLYENHTFLSEQKLEALKVVASPGKSVTITTLKDQPTTISLTLKPLLSFPGGPNYPDSSLTQDLKKFSMCDSALSSKIRNAYKCYGVFVLSSLEYPLGNPYVLTMFFDPDGNYLLMNMFEQESGGKAYRFGFGIKDPDYR